MNFIYTYFLLPLLLVLAHLVSIFSKRLRVPLAKRNRFLTELKTQKASFKQNSSVIIHCASMGEFEHIKPIIHQLKKGAPINIIVTFFSPSGYEFVTSYPGVDAFFYLPYDFKFIWKKFYSITQTKLLLISKHDVWPNQVAVAKSMHIPSILVNGSLNPASSRNSFFSRLVLSKAYQDLHKLFVISKDDAQQFIKSFKVKSPEVIGDTKFDQVLERQQEALKKRFLPKEWENGSPTLLYGSIWPQDARKVLLPLNTLLKEHKELRVILVPHQPNIENLSKIKEYLASHKYSFFSHKQFQERVLIVDTIGHLADLYKYADIAYVGGSFKQGIHNVLEPAIYGLPVIFGPVHKNSFEAEQLYKKGGAIVVDSASEFQNQITQLLKDTTHREEVGKKALAYASESFGSTKKVLTIIKEYL